MEQLLCPICCDQLVLSDGYRSCKNDHKYQIDDGILDLIPTITDSTLLDESELFDRVFEVGKRKYSIDQDLYIGSKLEHKSRELFERVVKQEWPNFANKRICIAELGCGKGSAYGYLGRIPFQSVDYIGADISLKSLQYCGT